MKIEESRARIMQIHSRKMTVHPDVNYDEVGYFILLFWPTAFPSNLTHVVAFLQLARCTEDFNGAMLKAVCVEAGMIALRRGAVEIHHEDYMEGQQKTVFSFFQNISPKTIFLFLNSL